MLAMASTVATGYADHEGTVKLDGHLLGRGLREASLHAGLAVGGHRVGDGAHGLHELHEGQTHVHRHALVAVGHDAACGRLIASRHSQVRTGWSKAVNMASMVPRSSSEDS